MERKTQIEIFKTSMGNSPLQPAKNIAEVQKEVNSFLQVHEVKKVTPLLQGELFIAVVEYFL